MVESVLLIDDDELTSFLIMRLLQNKLQIKDVMVKENGQEALSYLGSLQHNGNSFPGVILVDIDMPVMDGYAFIERYEKHYWKNHPLTPVLMITSSKRKMDIEKSLSYPSVRDCIFKPLTKEKLMVLENIYPNSE